MNAYLKQLKASLVLGVKNINSSVTPEYIKISDFLFFNFLDLDKSIIILLALLPPSTTSLFSALNIFGADNPDDLVVINIEVSGAAILMKP